MTGLANIYAVARREYTTRIHTRSFLFGTLILLLSVIAIAFAPIIVEAIDQSNQQKVAVHVTATDLQSDPVTTVSVLINGSADPKATTTAAKPDYVVTAVPDLGAARRAVIAGEYTAVLEIDRTSDGELAFTLYTNDNATGRTAALIHQASTSAIGWSDLASSRLTRRDSSCLRPSPSHGLTPPEPIRPRRRRISSVAACSGSGRPS